MIKYKKGYKYQLVEDYQIQTDICGYDINEDFLSLTPDGILTCKKGYAWDGATGVIDTNDIMRGSLIHDALYQLMRMGLISVEYREYADKRFKKICLEDGMLDIRAEYIFHGVRWLGKSEAESGTEREVLTAP